jgi:uncharacterized membrane protein
MKYLFYLLCGITAFAGAKFLRPRLTAPQRQIFAYAWGCSFLVEILLIVTAIILMFVHPNILGTIGLTLLGALVSLMLFIMLGFPIGWEYLIIQPLRQRRDRSTLAALLDIDRQPTTQTPYHAGPLELVVLFIGSVFATFVACLPRSDTYFYARAFALCLGMTGFLFAGTELLRRKVPTLERWISYLAVYILFPLLIYFALRSVMQMLSA